MKRFWLLALVLTMLPLTAGVGKAAGPGSRSGIMYVAVPDNPSDPSSSTTEIAVQVFYPSNYVDGDTYPVLLEVEGYGGAADPSDKTFVNGKDYVVVAMSLRGTGCSAGTLSLFSDQSSRDGAWIIDHWIADQLWYDDTMGVGIYGHSYGGLEGFLVAAQSPVHLKAVAVSGLIDDFYRGILYPGGVNNYGFPVLWGAGLRPESEHASHLGLTPTQAGVQNFVTDPSTRGPLATDAHCQQNYASHQTTDLVPSPQIFLDTYGSPFTKDATGSDVWAIKQSLLAHINGIKAPIQLGQQYQDEQTGPRGGHVLWQNLPSNVEKRITISTGTHNPNDPTGNKRDWLDCFLLRKGDIGASATSGHTCSDIRNPDKRVLLYFESEGSNRLAPYYASDWPLPNTDWQHYKLCGDGT
ncbi:MAG: hypothetical protein LC750_04270, partial [Actinobacteria bacterium]|nr:hypothetical protein [Actinomycetota bacterium]